MVVTTRYKEDISDAVPPERRGVDMRKTMMSQTWSSLPRVPQNSLPAVVPPKPTNTMKDDDEGVESLKPAASMESLSEWSSPEKKNRRRETPRVNSRFVVNPGMTGDLHHNWRSRAQKRAQSCGPGYVSDRGDKEPPKWIIRCGKWVLEQKPRLTLEEQIQRYQDAGERELLKKRYTDKVSRPGMMRRWNKRNPFGGFYEVN